MRTWRITFLVLWIVFATTLVLAKQLAIVTDTANPTKNLTTADLTKILNLKTHNRPDGNAGTVVTR
mgnify:CR=1 FL=1